MKIKSIENFKKNEIVLNTNLIQGGVGPTAGGTRTWSGCDSGMCYSSDYDHGNGSMDWHNIHDCSVDEM